MPPKESPKGSKRGTPAIVNDGAAGAVKQTAGGALPMRMLTVNSSVQEERDGAIFAERSQAGASSLGPEREFGRTKPSPGVARNANFAKRTEASFPASR